MAKCNQLTLLLFKGFKGLTSQIPGPPTWAGVVYVEGINHSVSLLSVCFALLSP